MGILQNIIGRFYVSKARKAQLDELVKVINEVKGVSNIPELQEAFDNVLRFRQTLSSNDQLINILGELIEYLIDTREHINNGYHKPKHNDWNVVRVYPDINDYLSLDVKINRF